MGEVTNISWARSSWSPWHGCVEVFGDDPNLSACTGCYAREFSKRLGRDIWGADKPRLFFSNKHWTQPIAWNERAKKTGEFWPVFCASMCDICEDYQGPDKVKVEEARTMLKQLVAATPYLTWQFLTKRPENYTRFYWPADKWPHNVWAGTTVEAQWAADERLPHLCRIGSLVLWISAEPLLGRLAVRKYPLDWYVVGGESGKLWQKRMLDLDAVADLEKQALQDGVAFWMKQDSGPKPGMRGRIPDELWRHQFPLGMKLKEAA